MALKRIRRYPISQGGSFCTNRLVEVYPKERIVERITPRRAPPSGTKKSSAELKMKRETVNKIPAAKYRDEVTHYSCSFLTRLNHLNVENMENIVRENIE